MGSVSGITDESLTEITTLDVSFCSLDSSEQQSRRGGGFAGFSLTTLTWLFLDFPSLTKLSKKKERKETRTQRLRREKTRGFRTTKINPQDYNIQFDLEDYLHKDKIKEIMNLESLEESLEEVLTISGSEMDEMFKCRGASSKSPSAVIRFPKSTFSWHNTD